MEDWKEYRLGEMIQCNPQVKLEKGKSYNLIDIDSIEIGSRYVKGKELTVYDGQSGCHFQNGDTVMARITPCLENGKIAQVQCESQKGFGSTELFVFRGTENKTDSDYVFNLMSMQFIRNLAANSMTGASGRQRADLGFIKRIKWNFPPLPTQQKIASILSAYDNLIQNYKKQIQALQTAASELYKEWFVRFRFPGYQTARFENGIPEGWKIARLKDIAKDVGKTITKNEINYEKDVYIPIDCIPNHNMALTEVSDIENAESSLQRFESGDILFGAMRVYFHKVIFAPMQGVTRKTCFVIHAKKDIFHNYLYSLLFSNTTINYANTISVGATMPYVRWNDFIRMQCLFPSEKILNDYNKIISPIFKTIMNSYKYLSNLTQQRDLLLPRLMSGKLEV